MSRRDEDSPSLSPEEFDRRVAKVLAEKDEIDSLVELINWFRRRYPTAKARLAYVRKRHADWTRRPPVR